MVKPTTKTSRNFFDWLRLPQAYRRLVCVLLTASILGLLMPYVVAERRKCVDGSQVALKLPDPVKALYDTDVKCRASLLAMEVGLAGAGDKGQLLTDDVVRQLNGYEKLRAMCNSLRSRISVTGYSDSHVKWLWSGLFVFLGMAVWVLPLTLMREQAGDLLLIARGGRAMPSCRKIDTIKVVARTFLQVFAVWVLYRLSPFWRNWEAWRLRPEVDQDRRSYSWTNPDIDIVGFVCQEMLAFCVAALTVFIWKKWHIEDVLVRSYLQQPSEDTTECSVRRLSATVTHAFHVCIVASVLLCAAFVPYTRFFWQMVNDVGDERYYNQAVVVHLLWLVTWIVVALPFFRLWLSWEEARNRLLGTDHPTAAHLTELEPVSRSHGALSAGVAILAAVYPLMG